MEISEKEYELKVNGEKAFSRFFVLVFMFFYVVFTDYIKKCIEKKSI